MWDSLSKEASRERPLERPVIVISVSQLAV
jgi:hypothetical protein